MTVGNVARTDMISRAWRFGTKIHRNEALGRPKNRWNDNINVCLQKTE
jgi:hypothetical protein